MNDLKDTLKILSKENERGFQLTGDFSLKLLKLDKSKEVNSFVYLLISKWFTPHSLGPTRFSEQQTQPFIDNIFINFKNMHYKSGNLLEKITGYLPNFHIIEKLCVRMKDKN